LKILGLIIAGIGFFGGWSLAVFYAGFIKGVVTAQKEGKLTAWKSR